MDSTTWNFKYYGPNETVKLLNLSQLFNDVHKDNEFHGLTKSADTNKAQIK